MHKETLKGYYQVLSDKEKAYLVSLWYEEQPEILIDEDGFDLSEIIDHIIYSE